MVAMDVPFGEHAPVATIAPSSLRADGQTAHGGAPAAKEQTGSANALKYPFRTHPTPMGQVAMGHGTMSMVSQSMPSGASSQAAIQFVPRASEGGSRIAEHNLLQRLHMESDSASPITSTGTAIGSPVSNDSPRRDAHMASEQRRRAIMRECFERLQHLLPPSEYRKPSKANLLQAAVSYISHLKNAERMLRTRIQVLHHDNMLMSQQINNVMENPPLQETGQGAPPSNGHLPITPAAGSHTAPSKY